MGGDDSNGSASMASQHPPVSDRTSLKVAPTDGSARFNTIRIPLIPVACWRLNDPAFAFDSSFVSSTFRDEIGTIAGVVASNPGCPAALFGHCDPAGSDALNKTLGDRRVIAIYATLTRQTAMWEDLYANPAVGDTWGTPAIQSILAALGDGSGNPYYAGAIDGIYGAGTRDAVTRFQTDSGLSADGDAGPDTRKVLFGAYIDWLCTPAGDPSAPPPPFRMQPSDFLGGAGAAPGDLPKMSLQSCGKFNPIVLLTSDEMTGSDKATRDSDDALNRRVLMFLFQAGTTVAPSLWPCPKVKEPGDACSAAFWPGGDAKRQNGDTKRLYKETRDTMACRFYDRFARRSPCEGGATVKIRLFDPHGYPIDQAPFQVTTPDGFSQSGVAQDGWAVLDNLPVPTQCTVLWSRTDAERRSYAWDPSAPLPPFEYELLVNIDIRGQDDTNLYRRLQNLGNTAPLDAAVRSFQVDTGNSLTGALTDVKAELVRRHDNLDPFQHHKPAPNKPVQRDPSDEPG